MRLDGIVKVAFGMFTQGESDRDTNTKIEVFIHQWESQGYRVKKLEVLEKPQITVFIIMEKVEK